MLNDVRASSPASFPSPASFELEARPLYRVGQRLSAGARALRGGQSGQSAIELALCLPVLLLIVTGSAVCGIAMNNYIMLTEAASVGGRTLAISRGQTLDPCSYAANAIYAAAPLLKSSNLTLTFWINGTKYSGSSCSSASATTGAAGNLTQNASAQVILTYPCNLVAYKANFAPTCNLQAQMTELVQ